jgi:hypothetical protein
MITKKCTICKKDLPQTVEFFATRNDRKNLIYQSSCRKCHKEYRKIHYQNNKDKYIKKAVKYKKEFLETFRHYKKSLNCNKCGENRYWVLDFHHLDPSKKDFEISSLVNKTSKKLLDKELEKCIVLCANCHRDLHYQEKQAGDA